jgi:hypothetical protein
VAPIKWAARSARSRGWCRSLTQGREGIGPGGRHWVSFCGSRRHKHQNIRGTPAWRAAEGAALGAISALIAPGGIFQHMLGDARDPPGNRGVPQGRNGSAGAAGRARNRRGRGGGPSLSPCSHTGRNHRSAGSGSKASSLISLGRKCRFEPIRATSGPGAAKSPAVLRFGPGTASTGGESRKRRKMNCCAGQPGGPGTTAEG